MGVGPVVIEVEDFLTSVWVTEGTRGRCGVYLTRGESSVSLGDCRRY